MDYKPPWGPPPNWRGSLAQNQAAEQYAAPSGPPPDWRGSSAQNQAAEQYAAPPGPPPNWKGSSAHDKPAGEYAPPPGPPPNRAVASGSSAPPGYQEWMSVPDTSQLPPPPAIDYTFSPTSNADENDAHRAREWCRQNPLVRPHQPTTEQHTMGTSGNMALYRPQNYRGSLVQVEAGLWRGSTSSECRDASLVSTLPMYFAAADSSIITGRPAHMYFEVKILSIGRPAGGDENSLAIGYCAIPYPTWRMPGWERGSLAVHSDDGRRFVSDNKGGKDFTEPFWNGETIGLGITFSGPGNAQGPFSGKGALNGEVFLTRNGQRVGGWNIHEELDSEHEWGTEGLDGAYDLYPCVGLYGAVSFEVLMDQRRWLWQGR